MNERTLNLQLFADAGTLVNTSTAYTDAYTGETTPFAGKNSLSGALKKFYDTELLENARTELYYAQFAKKQPLPQGKGRSVEWRKWNSFDKAGVLQEGVIPSGQKFGLSTKTGTIEQYGTYAAISDVLELHACDPVILAATEEMGASAAETQETLIRDGLLVNTNVLYCDNVTLATGKVSGTPTACNQMEASATVCSLLTPDMVAKAVTKLKKERVPTVADGKYYAVIHPSVAYDLRKSEGWLEAHKYADPEALLNGEIGELHGCRFIENVFAPVLDGEYANKAGTVTYATYFFGKDSFGIIDPAAGGMQMIVKDKSQVGGPLDQFSTVGYKLETNGATILYPERLLRVMSCSSYSAEDQKN